MVEGCMIDWYKVKGLQQRWRYITVIGRSNLEYFAQFLFYFFIYIFLGNMLNKRMRWFDLIGKIAVTRLMLYSKKVECGVTKWTWGRKI